MNEPLESREQIEQLLWLRRDGELDADDAVRLDAYLDAHPEAREAERDVAALDGQLRQVEPVEPPPGLRQAIRAAITAAPAREPRVRSRWAALRRWLAAAAAVPQLQLATGLLLGLGLYHLLLLAGEPGGPDRDSYYGAIGVAGNAEVETASISALPSSADDGLRVELDATSRLVLFRQGERLIALLATAPAREPEEIELTLEAVGSEVAIESVAQRGEAVVRRDAAGGRLRIRARSGASLTVVAGLGPGADRLAVTMTRAGAPSGNELTREVELAAIPELDEDVTNFWPAGVYSVAETQDTTRGAVSSRRATRPQDD